MRRRWPSLLTAGRIRSRPANSAAATCSGVWGPSKWVSCAYMVSLRSVAVQLVSPTLPSAAPGRISTTTYRWHVIAPPGDTSGMEVPIVGRSDELAQLRAALVTASGGTGRLVLVSGEPGIGKTRLAAAVTDM